MTRVRETYHKAMHSSLLFTDEGGGDKPTIKQANSAANFAGEVKREVMIPGSLDASDASYRPLIHHAPNNDQFTDATLDSHSSELHQNENKVGAIIYCFILAVFGIIVAASPWLPRLSLRLLSPILCSCNVIMLMATGILQDRLYAQAKRERRQGFLHFSDQLEFIAPLPFTLMSYGSAGLLLIVAWEHFIYTANVHQNWIVRVFILVELAWTGSLVGVYIWKLHIHNSSHMQPDAVNLLHSAMRPSILGDLRYMNGVSLQELQATLLHYQQQNLSFLNKEILRLQEILHKYEGAQDGHTPEVDVAHLLGAREQELRSVAAERDQLQSEIRLARSLIAERDADFLRVRTINDKYIAESERLRAMLDEWSARTAKLELALENERMSNAELQKQILSLQQLSAESTYTQG